jgi:hypothetical protein
MGVHVARCTPNFPPVQAAFLSPMTSRRPNFCPVRAEGEATFT